ncbi:pyridoxal-dependent decarboxylase (plasmid) [Bacillus cereus]|uniref:pyridoxal phosphate-dependent decarboxylase family protein n=1 Tax=Bacillus cereus TaxID=1396 RepID=UPI0007B69F45|nr:pyridoxal-dependent decarboxylase [Bacillus cereus]ANC23023.1 pyridoxal-dependent decarboxylase [Bacillus cereus]
MDNIKKYFINNENENEVKDYINEVINLGLDFKKRSKVKEASVDLENIDRITKIPIKGEELNNLLELFKEEILPYCTNFSSVNFMGFPDSGNSISGITGAIMSDFLQQNLINSSFCSPIATHMEISVINWLRQILGYPISEKINNVFDVGGIITYGGTGSNATAMLLARENHKSNTMETGVINPEKFKVIVPKGIGHYSISSSLMWIGLGNNIIEVETNNYKYNLCELEKTVKKYKDEIMCVVSYVGDSRTMTIEHLNEVHDIVKGINPNIWLHADACHGFSLAFSEKHKQKLKGLNLYDSISTDPHKVLHLPYCISALLIKDAYKMSLLSSKSDLIMNEPFALGQITPFIGSKSWISLKLWFAMKNIGIENIGKTIDRRIELALFLKNKLNTHSKFIVLNDVDINSVMFLYVGDNENKSIEAINKLNQDIYKTIQADGNYYVHQFPINDNKKIISDNKILYPLRFMSGNANLTEKNIEDLIFYIENIGGNLQCTKKNYVLEKTY